MCTETTPLPAQLDILTELYAALDWLASEEQRLIDQVTPAEVKAAIADIKFEMGAERETLQQRIAAAEGEIKAAVLEHGASVKSVRLQAVYVRGRVSYDAKALDRYCGVHPELLAFRSESAPTVSLRSVK